MKQQKSLIKFFLIIFLLVNCMSTIYAQNVKMIPQTLENPYPIKPKTITPLIAMGGSYSSDFGEFGPLSHLESKQFWLTEWKSSEQLITWSVSVPQKGDYKIILIIKSSKGEQIVLSSDESEFIFSTQEEGWQRATTEDFLTLNKGVNSIKVRLARTAKEALSIKSIELIAEKEEKAIAKRIKDFKGDISWMKNSGYGIMVQGGGWAYPRTGDKKVWPGFAEDFDAEAFVEKVDEMGGKFLVWSATWMTYHFSAPIKAIGEILPERVSKRDLIGDLIKECEKRDIRFMLYYHLGHGEKSVLEAKGWIENWMTEKKRDRSTWLNREVAIFKEMGARYGKGLDAIFLDDGCTWYPADFEILGKALKTGNPDRVISYNPWIAPLHTPFQDFYSGEDFTGQNTPWPIKNGIVTSGPQKGLQCWGCFVLEGPGWGVYEPNTIINEPKSWSVETLVNLTKKLEQEQYSVAINVLIYEDGSMGESSYNLLKDTAKKLKRGKWAEK